MSEIKPRKGFMARTQARFGAGVEKSSIGAPAGRPSTRQGCPEKHGKLGGGAASLASAWKKLESVSRKKAVRRPGLPREALQPMPIMAKRSGSSAPGRVT